MHLTRDVANGYEVVRAEQKIGILGESHLGLARNRITLFPFRGPCG